jgi:hypothetical protein
VSDSRRAAKIETLVDQLLEKKSKRERREVERRRKEEERRERRENREREKEKIPKTWVDFKNAGYKVYHFRRIKYKGNKFIDHTRKKGRSWYVQNPFTVFLLFKVIVLQ